ncbi:hypothetical protein PGT21_003429 [Puccinia graminis f. sp. tritici]|uniref:Manganese/iron superoxide dismutase C-terminal domain-containing protein n=1 Tax=Puccinia graminis f. sp. tritici TaxID=56615 RepID=A0A5B0MB41_PUCGR|nr:hypothetical protein PGT21_003429 [Puccinia graminis f. sp. tritici]
MKPTISVQQIIINRPTSRIASPSIRLRPRNPAHTSKAGLHVSPPITSLPYSIDQGLTPFLSAKTVKSLAIDWQDGLLDRLNQHVKGTPAENKSLFDTIVDLAKDRTQVIPFNLASEALNNSFFLNGLKQADPHQAPNRPSEGSLLATAIDETYGSITQFISYFSNAAMGMSSSGYIWMVCDQDGTLGICATYGAGTILVQNREQRGDWPMAIRSSQIGLDASGRPLPKQQTSPASPPTGSSAQDIPAPSADHTQGHPSPNVRSFSTSASPLAETSDPSHSKPSPEKAAKPMVSFADSLFASPTPPPQPTRQTSSLPLNRAITRKNTNPAERFNHLHPLLNLAVAERAYLVDHGVWGKDSYLRQFWKCVDWAKVELAFSKFAPKPSYQSHSSIWKT